MIIILGSKVRVACKKSGRKKRNYKKVGAVGADTTSNISPIPYTPPCGIVKIVAGCKNFACVCVRQSKDFYCIISCIYGLPKL